MGQSLREIDSILISCAVNGDGDGVLKALSEGANPLAVNASGWTALMWAAMLGNLREMEILLPVSDANMQNNLGWTALMLASWEGKDDSVKLLIPVTDPSVRDLNGANARDLAEQQRYWDVVALLDTFMVHWESQELSSVAQEASTPVKQRRL